MSERPGKARVGGDQLATASFWSRITFTAIPFFKIERGSPLTRAIIGLVLVLVAFFAPGGIMSLCHSIKARIIKVIPNPPADADRITPAYVEPPAEAEDTLSSVSS